MATTTPVPIEVTVTPNAEPVSTGLQTITGYLGVVGLVVSAVLAQADVMGLPDWATVVLIGLAAGLGAITNRNRSDQKVANTQAAGAVAAAALAPVTRAELLTGTGVTGAVEIETVSPLPEPDEVQT